MIDLKPCPMCGKEAALGTTKIQRQADHSGRYKEFTGHHVNCIWCGVSNRGIAEGFETPEKAAEHWNKRTVTEVVALEQRKMMRAALEGCRGLAEAEAAHGSKVWKRAIGLIDDALNYREPVSPLAPLQEKP